MRVSQFPVSTIKETPADAVVISHQLMLRAGLIRQLASGLYTWAPYGLRVLRKVEAIVREEMNKSAVEILMPGVQPADLWQETGRWDKYGAELLRLRDRHNNEFCVGPTHEEVVTDYARRELRSYKQLPVTYYQIQTKFRDEVRPRFGVMRAREFLMKDAYSFHASQESLQSTYDAMYDTYHRIFQRLQLDFRAVEADTGSIGGNSSHEFHVLAKSGEDDIVFSSTSDYAANIELAACAAPTERAAATADMAKVATPNEKSIDEVCASLGCAATQTVKTLIVLGAKENEDDADTLVALVLRGDHEINEIKAEKHPMVLAPLTFATEEQVKAAAGCAPGSVGPVGLDIPVIYDATAAMQGDIICGANEDGQHLTRVNFGRDLPEPEHVADLRNVVAGEALPNGNGTAEIKRGIEVGHIFQLGENYAESLKATVLDENGKAKVMTMGCYGIGVSRVVAAAIEQNHDDNGIMWPAAIAPFQVVVVPLNAHKSEAVREESARIYDALVAAGVDVLVDDRDARPGVKFADMELLGIPYRVVVGDRGLERGAVEFRARTASENEDVSTDDIVAKVIAALDL